MRATGAVRKIDSFGKVVIPIEMMKSLEIYYGDPIEFLLFTGEYIILRKHKPYINTLEDIKFTKDEMKRNNVSSIDKIDETIRLLNNIKKLYKTYMGMD